MYILPCTLAEELPAFSNRPIRPEEYLLLQWKGGGEIDPFTFSNSLIPKEKISFV